MSEGAGQRPQGQGEAVRVPAAEGVPMGSIPVPRAKPPPRSECTRPGCGDEVFAPRPWADGLNNFFFIESSGSLYS